MTNRNYFKIKLPVHLGCNSIQTELGPIEYNAIDSPPSSFICYALEFGYLFFLIICRKGQMLVSL